MTYHQDIARKVSEFNKQSGLKRKEEAQRLILGYSQTVFSKNNAKLNTELADAIAKKVAASEPEQAVEETIEEVVEEVVEENTVE